jgi:periplasmic protein TonB
MLHSSDNTDRLNSLQQEKVEARPIEEPLPEVPPAPNPQVAVVPPPPQELKQETPRRQEPRPPAPVTSAPAAIREQTAALTAAPNQGQIAPRTSDAVPTWKTRVVALLERNKRYPGTAQSRREQGVAQIFFSLDRQGRVIDSRSCAHPARPRSTRRRWRCCAAHSRFPRRRVN